MKYLKRIPNGILLILIGLLHTRFALSSEGFGKQFMEFSESYFYSISSGLDEFAGKSILYEVHAAFWFFYMGILLIPLGLLVYSVERSKKNLPLYFTISYLIYVLIGSYMVPASGMTYFMLPHAIFMLVVNCFKYRNV